MAENNKSIRSQEEKELIINARKPEGELGDKLLDRMNESHESLAQWGVSHLDIAKDDVILDIGCGGGVNVERFLKMTENKVYGLDYSEVAVEKSAKLNHFFNIILSIIILIAWLINFSIFLINDGIIKGKSKKINPQNKLL